ncbi:ATP-binding protein [Streptomyces sp. NPDC020965]|uniref:ATP-binding protein n=1 Tax=Streptomyces sp. NPDC020965 TaxID=3365105 RepID=UPI00378A45CF
MVIHPGSGSLQQGSRISLITPEVEFAQFDAGRRGPGEVLQPPNRFLPDLLISELVTNGLQYGRAEVVGVRLWRTGTYVGIEVISGGGAQVPCPREAGRYDEGGRGLRLVGVLADAWGVTPDGARTWCLLAIAGGE